MEDKLHLLFDCPLYSSLRCCCILGVADFAVAYTYSRTTEETNETVWPIASWCSIEREGTLCRDGRVVSASIIVNRLKTVPIQTHRQTDLNIPDAQSL